MMTQSGRVPNIGDVVRVAGFDFRVDTVEGRRIQRVHISPVSDKSKRKGAPSD